MSVLLSWAPASNYLFCKNQFIIKIHFVIINGILTLNNFRLCLSILCLQKHLNVFRMMLERLLWCISIWQLVLWFNNRIIMLLQIKDRIEKFVEWSFYIHELTLVPLMLIIIYRWKELYHFQENLLALSFSAKFM